MSKPCQSGPCDPADCQLECTFKDDTTSLPADGYTCQTCGSTDRQVRRSCTHGGEFTAVPQMGEFGTFVSCDDPSHDTTPLPAMSKYQMRDYIEATTQLPADGLLHDPDDSLTPDELGARAVEVLTTPLPADVEAAKIRLAVHRLHLHEMESKGQVYMMPWDDAQAVGEYIATLTAEVEQLTIALSGAVKMLDHIAKGGYYTLGEYYDRLAAYKKVLGDE